MIEFVSLITSLINILIEFSKFLKRQLPPTILGILSLLFFWFGLVSLPLMSIVFYQFYYETDKIKKNKMLIGVYLCIVAALLMLSVTVISIIGIIDDINKTELFIGQERGEYTFSSRKYPERTLNTQTYANVNDTIEIFLFLDLNKKRIGELKNNSLNISIYPSLNYHKPLHRITAVIKHDDCGEKLFYTDVVTNGETNFKLLKNIVYLLKCNNKKQKTSVIRTLTDSEINLLFSSNGLYLNGLVMEDGFSYIISLPYCVYNTNSCQHRVLNIEM